MERLCLTEPLVHTGCMEALCYSPDLSRFASQWQLHRHLRFLICRMRNPRWMPLIGMPLLIVHGKGLSDVISNRIAPVKGLFIVPRANRRVML